jgi:uncharacterized protein (DUF58 family)
LKGSVSSQRALMIWPLSPRKPAPQATLAPPSEEGELFGAGFLDQLRSVSLTLGRTPARGFQGERRSSIRGSGLEFIDHRPYVPGDDLRLLDLEVYKRHRRLFIRQYEEQSESDIYIIIDISASMVSPSPRKLRAALRLAAALGYLGLIGLDRVTALAVSGPRLTWSPPFRGRPSTLSLLRFLERLEAQGTTGLLDPIREFVTRGGRPGSVFLLTDGYDQKGTLGAIDVLRAGRYDVTLVQLADDSFIRDLPLGELLLVDAETGERTNQFVTIERRNELQQKQIALRETTRRLALSRGVQTHILDADLPLKSAARRVAGRRSA